MAAPDNEHGIAFRWVAHDPEVAPHSEARHEHRKCGARTQRALACLARCCPIRTPTSSALYESSDSQRQAGVTIA